MAKDLEPLDGRTVVLSCTHSGGAARAELERSGWLLPNSVEWVDIPCGGALDELHILRAFEARAERVLVLTCQTGACHSLDGSRWAKARVEAVRELLEEVGISGSRLIFQQVAPSMGADIARWLRSETGAQG
ncbi:MAG: hydrogenase iron-sulfur subunit [Anaerolineae bacterium]|nr:hydrogenase iron-sulfur subunit [Anaerolineae bacterium]